MELLQLKYFREVARCESITKTANRFLIPQPAMSQTISRLEKELGTQLFDRTNNRISLNNHGKTFLKYVEQALDALEVGITAISQENFSDSKINILILQNRNQMLDILHEFKSLYPEVSYSIYHSYESGSNIDFDIRICSEKTNEKNFVQYPLWSEEIALAVNDKSPLARKMSVSLTDLENESFISMNRSSALSKIVEAALPVGLLNQNNCIFCDDPYYVRKYISLGYGVCFIPRLSWSGLFDDNVVILPIKDKKIKRNTYLVYNNKNDCNSAAFRFREFILSRENKPQNLLK